MNGADLERALDALREVVVAWDASVAANPPHLAMDYIEVQLDRSFKNRVLAALDDLTAETSETT